MTIHCYNENHPYLLFIDIEFDKENLIQFAGLLFRRIDNEVYQLIRSGNQYKSPDNRVCYPFVEYTGLTNDFLKENGIPAEDLKNFIIEDMLEDIPLNELEIISHGLRNDRLVLLRNGINLSTYTEDGKSFPIDGYCTYKNARRILNRNSNLKEGDLAEESGYFMHNAHNAFCDVWGEVSVFTYLKKVETQRNWKE